MKQQLEYGAEISSEEVKNLQLFIMDEIDAFCKKNEIPYFLVAGSLIGAVRHKGYIPWDDDIDIALKREDYEKLLSSFESQSNKVSILTHKNEDTYIYPFAKAIHTDTVLFETDKKHPLGVNIDIFPLDAMPPVIEECMKVFKRVKRYRNILDLKHMAYDAKRPFYKNAVVFVGHLLFKFIPDKTLLNKLESIFEEQNRMNQDKKFIASLCGAWGTKELCYTEDFDLQLQASFEARDYSIPKGYDRILTGLYGDYMQPPPIEQRMTHHCYKAYWKKQEN